MPSSVFQVSCTVLVQTYSQTNTQTRKIQIKKISKGKKEDAKATIPRKLAAKVALINRQIERVRWTSSTGRGAGDTFRDRGMAGWNHQKCSYTTSNTSP